MTNTDTEFDFDCPRYSYELVTVSGQSSVVDIKHIDQWFLKYHAEHDRKSLLQPEATKEKSLFGRPSVANTMKATSSLVGSARSLKRPSTVSAISSTAQISTLSARRCSQKSDEQNGDSGRNDQSVKNCRISIGSKRKSCLDQDGETEDVTSRASAADMRDKLDEFRQRKKRESTIEQSSMTSAVRTLVPQNDYSRSKILVSEAKPQVSSAVVRKAGASGTTRIGMATSARTAAAPAIADSTDRHIVPAVRPVSKRYTATNGAAPVTVDKHGSGSGILSKRKPGNQPTSTSAEDDTAMMELLKKHNKRFAPIPIYEPPRHSVRDVRKWEKSSGKTWLSLKPEEREVVNAEIENMKNAIKNAANH